MNLRDFNSIHMGEDCSNLSGVHENELFFGCKFNKLAGLTLSNCVLDHSTFETASIRDALGFTVTLDCHSFSGVELSPLVFNLMLSLLLMTKGNDEQREQIEQVIGKEKVAAFRRLLKVIE
jgi:hypothetical protein